MLGKDMTQPKNRDLKSEAAAWHARLAADDVSEQDFLQFEQWISDPDCRAAYDDIQTALFDVEDHSNEIRKSLAEHNIPSAGPAWSRPASTTSRWKTRRGVFGGAIAAAGALAAVFFVAITQFGSQAALEGVVYAAGPDTTRSITLADNTEITLNRGTEVTIYWGKAERRVVLTDGEASFDVQHDPDRPMSVIAGTDEIKDVGTVFNVLKDGSRLTVTVAEGEVAVVPQSKPAQRVRADFQYEIDHASDTASLKAVDPEAALAWQQGRLIYRNTPLTEIVRDLNRYSDKSIRIADKDAASLIFSGTLRIEPTGAMLDTLEKFLPVEVKETDGTFLVESR
jgi:transmembrane sensor